MESPFSNESPDEVLGELNFANAFEVFAQFSVLSFRTRTRRHFTVRSYHSFKQNIYNKTSCAACFSALYPNASTLVFAACWRGI